MLCDISNDFGHSQDLFQHSVPRGHTSFGLHQKELSHKGLECILARSRNCLFTVRARQQKKHLANGGVCIFVTFAQSITFESIVS